MKLIKVRIENYKCIFDTNEFTTSDTTCLVGKNESGKTAIVEALCRLNPIDKDYEKFDTLFDYPRIYLTDYEESRKTDPNFKDANVLTTTWEVTQEEIEILKTEFGENCLHSKTIVIKKGYDNEKLWTLQTNDKSVLIRLIKSAGLAKEEQEELLKIETLEEVKTRINQYKEPSEKLTSLKALIAKKFADNSIHQTILNKVSSFLPKFLLFSEYDIMPGIVSFDVLNNKIQNNKLSIEDKIFLAFLETANTNPREIGDIGNFDRLKAKLQAVSSRISREIFEYWSQNKHLKVDFSFDAARLKDPAPFNSGFIFRTFIENTKHSASVNFDERSKGFVWFFSFLIWFSRIKTNYGNNLIILLDEPGLNLHGRAQLDLLRYIAEKLTPNYQVIYTTHSPFMINPSNLLDVRLVEDTVSKEDKIQGTKVSDEVLATDKETVFPLQAALGYDITQSLFIGENCLLVEGPSDLLYLNWISQELKSRKRIGLSSEWTITPVGSIDKIGSFIALFGGNKINVAVLTDFQKGHKNKIRQLKESDLLKKGQVFSAEMFVSQDEADTEDIFGREFYISLINQAYELSKKHQLDSTATPTNVRITEEVAKHFATLPSTIAEYNHYFPSKWLLENGNQFVTTLSNIDFALDNFEKIFKTLNALLN
jgi:predicted ATP-dependent endonuclease of OLD family